MRCIYYMKDAREMATKLTSFPNLPEGTNDEIKEKLKDKNWMESKIFHFPSRSLATKAVRGLVIKGNLLVSAKFFLTIGYLMIRLTVKPLMNNSMTILFLLQII